MQPETQAGLETSKAFLKDSVELTHLLLKQQLEALQRGEQIDWKTARELVREGRASARQLAQIASLELRGEKQAQAKPRPEPKAEPRPVPQLNLPRETMQGFARAMMDWSDALRSATPDNIPPLPQDVQELMRKLGLDPADDRSLEELIRILEGQQTLAA
ncbi:MAG: hypothetical protein H6841_08240 [Planctomycetes bacterium]|nr:hypothetical protein [Planctomycetota bacterium]